MSDLAYYGLNNDGMYTWGNDITSFAPGSVTDAANIATGQRWDGVGGVDLGGTVNEIPGQGSFWGNSFSNFNNSLSSIGKIAGIGSSLAQTYVGLAALGIAKDELAIKKDKWNMAKQEIKHMQATRRRLTSSYMNGGKGVGSGSGGGAGKSW